MISMQPHSNGKTPLILFEDSKASNEDKKEIKALLEERMGLDFKQNGPI